VDGNDFLLWQRQIGRTGPSLRADADGDRAVGGADLAVWGAAFGATGTNGAAVRRDVMAPLPSMVDQTPAPTPLAASAMERVIAEAVTWLGDPTTHEARAAASKRREFNVGKFVDRTTPFASSTIIAQGLPVTAARPHVRSCEQFAANPSQAPEDLRWFAVLDGAFDAMAHA
jgi:hypothetical protein